MNFNTNNPYFNRGLTLLVGLVIGYLLTMVPFIHASMLAYCFTMLFANLLMLVVG
jgi:hypothetical protein